MAEPDQPVHQPADPAFSRIRFQLTNLAKILGGTLDRISALAAPHQDAVWRVLARLNAAFGTRHGFLASLRGAAGLDAGARAALELGPELLDLLRELGAQETVCPLLLEAVACRAPAEALALLESEEPALLAERAMLTGLLAWEYAPACTVAELAGFTDVFIRFLEANREAMLRTGLPQSHFEAFPFLDVFAPLCPPAPAAWIRPSCLCGERGGPWLAHTRLRLFALRGCCPTEHSGCACLWANALRTVAPEDAARAEAGLPGLLGLKIDVLRVLRDSARSGSTEGLWPSCLGLMTRALRASDVDLWFRIDAAYGGDIREGVLTHGARFVDAGGLGSLLWLVGWFEAELAIGPMRGAREARELLPAVGRPASYFDLAGRPERARLDRALDRMRALGARSREAWAGFGQRVNAALEGEFEDEVMVPVRVKRTVAGKFQADAGAWAAVVGAFANLGVPPEELGRPAAAAPAMADAGRRNAETFPSLPGLRWEEVTIRFVSDTAVRIRARGVERSYGFAEIGFKDGRKDEKPNELWSLLQVLARCGGRIAWEDARKGDRDAERKRGAMKTKVKELRKLLCAVLGIDEDPFRPYRTARAYEARFAVIDHGNREPSKPDED